MAVAIGFGSKIQVNDGVSAAYADFENVTQITMPSIELAFVESTHLESANRFREYVSGLKEPGEFSFEAMFTDDEYSRILGLIGDAQTFKVVLPDTSSAVFSGFITKCDMDVTTDAIPSMKTTGKVTSSVTFTVAA